MIAFQEFSSQFGSIHNANSSFGTFGRVVFHKTPAFVRIVFRVTCHGEFFDVTEFTEQLSYVPFGDGRGNVSNINAIDGAINDRGHQGHGFPITQFEATCRFHDGQLGRVRRRRGRWRGC